ncbi:hypothetical protein [Mucilaginibacter sp.]|nr:hypothetical protein [Mucilaginibacter sp.]
MKKIFTTVSIVAVAYTSMAQQLIEVASFGKKPAYWCGCRTKK